MIRAPSFCDAFKKLYDDTPQQLRESYRLLPEIRSQAGVAEMQADDMVKLDTVHGSPGLVSRYLAPDGQTKKIPRSCDRPAGGTKEFIGRTHSQ